MSALAPGWSPSPVPLCLCRIKVHSLPKFPKTAAALVSALCPGYKGCPEVLVYGAPPRGTSDPLSCNRQLANPSGRKTNPKTGAKHANDRKNRASSAFGCGGIRV